MSRKQFLEVMGAGLGLVAEEAYAKPVRKKPY
jgi:hypothetical protein